LRVTRKRSSRNGTAGWPRTAHDLGLSRHRRRSGRIDPALGCNVHSRLATALGANTTAAGFLVVDSKQQTCVSNLYAAGDVVSDLHQLSVAEGHAAVAATAIHNSLARNFR
jgi:thioredoxin reductase (NADPH)